MADINLSAAKAAVGTLKEAQNVGKQLSGVVTDQQADMEKAVHQQHTQRLQARAKQEYLISIAEFKAFEKYEKEKAQEKEIEKLKAQAIQKYGKNAWSEIEATKLKMIKEREEENKYMDKDRQKQIQAFWWCATAAALITYFFKLYK